MGNRAVIVSSDTTRENKHHKIGIYLHSAGDIEDISSFLEEAKQRKIRSLKQDESYFWARFIQTVADLVTEYLRTSNHRYGLESNPYELSVGVGIVDTLDCNNGDNGVYYIDDNFEIVRHTDGQEL